MAEILIQRKRHRRVWPWLVGLVGVLVLALLPWPFFDDREEAPASRERLARRDTLAERRTPVLQDTARTTVGATGAAAPQSVTRTTATAGGAVVPAAPTQPTAAPPKVDTAAVAPTNPAPAGTAFERFIAARDPNPDERAHRRYTANGLRRLADELRTLGASEAGVRTIRLNADSLLSSARVSARPDYARAAFLAAVREIDALRGRYAVAVDTGRLRAAAWAITPDRRLLAQRGRVQTFFEAARDALHSLPRRQ